MRAVTWDLTGKSSSYLAISSCKIWCVGHTTFVGLGVKRLRGFFLQPELRKNFLPGFGGINWDNGFFLRKYGWFE
jgi:hypothetical protein